MKFWRALVFLLVVSSGWLGGGVLQAPVAVAATPSVSTPLAAEDAATQARAFGEAYNLMLDHFVSPLDTKALRIASRSAARSPVNSGVSPGAAALPAASLAS